MLNINKVKYQSAQVTISREVLEFFWIVVQTSKLITYLF